MNILGKRGEEEQEAAAAAAALGDSMMATTVSMGCKGVLWKEVVEGEEEEPHRCVTTRGEIRSPSWGAKGR